MVASRRQSPRGPRGTPDRGRTSLQHRRVMFAGSGLPCRTKTCVIRCVPLKSSDRGEVREWTNRHAWKACVSATGPWVRIPPSPPSNSATQGLRRRVSWNCHRERTRWDSNEGDRGGEAPLRVEARGGGPPQWERVSATSNAHPLRQTGLARSRAIL